MSVLSAEQLTSLKPFGDVGFVSSTIEPVAVRGDRLFLFKLVSGTADGLELAVLSLVELAPSGRFAYTAWYDEGDLDAAIDELDERFLAGEGAEHADVYQPVVELLHRHRAHDWDGYRDLLADDFVLVDHRRVGLPATDRDGFIEFLRGYAESEADWVTLICKLHRVGR
jgi:hypothetical protein